MLAGCLIAACSDAEVQPRSSDPQKLSSRGLYANFGKRSVVSEALEYAPEFALWSDGADKRRWLILPPGSRIDTSDLAHWDFPVGTKLFKEFSLEGTLLETRLIERVKATGRTKEDFFMGSFIWLADQSEALLDMNGRDNVNGTEHDVPAQKFCSVCHVGEPSAVLGFSAVQLAVEETQRRVNERGVLSAPLERSYAVPGDDVQRAALGSLHANCGHCHAEGAHDDFMHLRILPSEADTAVADLDAYKNMVGVALSDEWKERPSEYATRIVPGDPDMSAIVYRMTQRGDDELVQDQMPPIASRKVDVDGLAAVRTWVESLRPEPPGMDAGPPRMAPVMNAETAGHAPPAVEMRPSEPAEMPAPSMEMPIDSSDLDAGVPAADSGSPVDDLDAGVAEVDL
ncbi:MAG: hypothetical protein RL701_6220 [Pseudomonadota bacterium]